MNKVRAYHAVYGPCGGCNQVAAGNLLFWFVCVDTDTPVSIIRAASRLPDDMS